MAARQQESDREPAIGRGLTFQEAINIGLASYEGRESFNCLVTAMASVETWCDKEGLIITLGDHLSKRTLASSEVMFSDFVLRANSLNDTEETKS
jgi:hypothetical protein